MVFIWFAWLILGSCLFLLVDGSAEYEFFNTDIKLTGGSLSERLASLSLILFIISEGIILYRKNQYLQRQITERFKLNLDFSKVSFDILKERNRIFKAEVMKYMQDDPSFDLENLSQLKSQGNDVFQKRKKDLDGRIETIQNLETLDKKSSSIHFFIIFGVLFSTIIWGWGSIISQFI